MARVAPGGESLWDVVSGLVRIVASHQSELKHVRGELKRVSDELRETREKGSGNESAKIKAAKDSGAGAPPAAAAAVETITYDEATGCAEIKSSGPPH